MHCSEQKSKVNYQKKSEPLMWKEQSSFKVKDICRQFCRQISKDFKMLKKGNSTDKMSSGKTYSTFVDNVSNSTNFVDENHPSSSMMSRKSSTISLQQKPLPSTASTNSFQRHYNKPPGGKPDVISEITCHPSMTSHFYFVCHGLP